MITTKRQWEANPRCSICGIVTELAEKNNRGIVKDHTATFGHVYSKTDIRRFLNQDSWQLECHKCNLEKTHTEDPIFDYQKLYGTVGGRTYPELLITLAEDENNQEFYLTQIEFKRDT